MKGKAEERRRDVLVVVAASLGTIFEWYDFFVYGTLAALIAQQFFPSESGTASFLLALATFGVGFLVRPLGAAVFGHLGDLIGRKYTFLITIMLMGCATFFVGLLPNYSQIGIAAPLLLVLCRVVQGLALGGEYGGAAIFVAEHAPPGRRGLYTGFIQGSATAGFMLSLAVVMTTASLTDADQWSRWGWRIPFLVSVILLGLSLWIRLKLKESPVFQAMKDAGQGSANPIRESFSSGKQVRAMLVVMFGVAAGLTVVWYTAQFHVLYFLQNTLRIEDNWARSIVAMAAVSGLIWPVLFGALSDKVGRRKLILSGYLLAIVAIFPLFHWIADSANPRLMAAMRDRPLVVSGSDCHFDIRDLGRQDTECGRVLDLLSSRGLAYTKVMTAPGTPISVSIGGRPIDPHNDIAFDAALSAAGYPVEKAVPPRDGLLKVVLAIVMIGILSGMTNGPVGALLVEMFPTRLRYTSISIPYHVGSGYFGGFLPLITQMIAAATGDPFAGLWYVVGVLILAFVVSFLWLPETAGRTIG